MKKLFGRDKLKAGRPKELSTDFNPVPDPPTLTPIYAAHAQTQQARRNGSATHEHHLSSDDEPWQHIPSFDPHLHSSQLTGPASRSSSLASVIPHQQQQQPQQQSLQQQLQPAQPHSLPPPSQQQQQPQQPPQPQQPVPMPRTNSPFAGAPPAPPSSVRTTHRDQHLSVDREKDLPPTKRSGGGAAAVSILKSLDPQFEAPKVTRTEETRSYKEDDYASSVTHTAATDTLASRDDRRERKGFWDWAADRREERREQKERAEQSQDELMRLIGYLTATSSEDFSVVLDVCEKASASEANAKEAAKALRREFKYGDVPQQLSAARLWAIMLRNASEIFVHQCMARKFLDALEDTITKNTTSPVVKERLLDVLAAASYASQPRADGKQDGFRSLWRKLKPPGKPEEGYPFDNDDAMFYPPNARRRSAILNTNNIPPALHPQTHSPNLPSKDLLGTQKSPPLKQKPSSRNRIIPIEEDIKRLFQECTFARGNAQLLSDALAFARPEDLERNVIKEFYEKCRNSQELILAQIPWATAGADRSRQRRLAQQAEALKPQRPRTDSNRDESPVELTVEEKLLAALLEANEALISVLRVYEDTERIGVEREAEERSKREVRIDRSKLVYDEKEGIHLEPPTREGGGSSSRSPSPSPLRSTSPVPSSLMPAVHPNANHPLPVPPQLGAVNLAPPPPAPQGPRLPGSVMMRTHTPEPEPSFTFTAPTPADYGVGKQRINIIPVTSYRSDDDDSEEAVTPVKPSATALGKRPMAPVDNSEDAFNPDDIFYERTDAQNNRPGVRADSSAGSEDEGDGARGWPHNTRPPVHYAYDAVAERTQQLMREHAQLTATNGVH